MGNYYELLGVAETASDTEIRTAFRSLVQTAMDDQPRFAALTEAFETLKDPAKRAAYDATRSAVLPDKTALGGFTQTIQGNQTIQMPTQAAPVISSGGALMRSGACPVCQTIGAADDGFCTECGLLLAGPVGAVPTVQSLPTLVDGTGRTFLLKLGESIVGREGADILLPDKTISRRHAKFVVAEGNYVTLDDLGSTNGTKIAGAPLVAGQPKALSSGTVLKFGSVTVTIHIPTVAAPNRLALPAASAESKRSAPIAAIAGGTSAARLVGAGGVVHTLKAVVTTFGRKAGNDVVITTDSFISGSHAKVLYEDGRYKLIDIGSTNGTRVNGRKLSAGSPEPLADGDTVQLGQTQFTFYAPK